MWTTRNICNGSLDGGLRLLPPTNLFLLPVSDEEVLVTWTTNDSKALFTDVYYRESPSGSLILAGSVSSTNPSAFTITGLVPAGLYDVRLQNRSGTVVSVPTAFVTTQVLYSDVFAYLAILFDGNMVADPSETILVNEAIGFLIENGIWNNVEVCFLCSPSTNIANAAYLDAKRLEFATPSDTVTEGGAWVHEGASDSYVDTNFNFAVNSGAALNQFEVYHRLANNELLDGAVCWGAADPNNTAEFYLKATQDGGGPLGVKAGADSVGNVVGPIDIKGTYNNVHVGANAASLELPIGTYLSVTTQGSDSILDYPADWPNLNIFVGATNNNGVASEFAAFLTSAFIIVKNTDEFLISDLEAAINSYNDSYGRT